MSVEDSSPFAFVGLDRVFHERARLGIVTSLAGPGDGLTFAELKRLCGLTDGNLNRHLAVLEEAGHIVIEKRFEGRRSQTRCRLTRRGRAQFVCYLEALEKVLQHATQLAAGDCLAGCGIDIRPVSG